MPPRVQAPAMLLYCFLGDGLVEGYGLSLGGDPRSRHLQGYWVCTAELPAVSLVFLEEFGWPWRGRPWCAGALMLKVKVMCAREWPAGLGHRW